MNPISSPSVTRITDIPAWEMIEAESKQLDKILRGQLISRILFAIAPLPILIAILVTHIK